MHRIKFPRGKIILNSIPFLLALIVFLLVRLGVHFPGQVEQYYSRGIYPVIAGVFSMISGLISWSLWDSFWIGTVIWAVTGLVLVIIRRISIKLFFLRIFQSVAIFYSIFYLTWGFNYFRPNIETRLGWNKVKLYEEDFRNILDTLIVKTNETYTSFTTNDYNEIQRQLEDSYGQNSEMLGITWPYGSRNPKTILVSSYFAKSGVSGYFGPFFNEVHINHYQLPMDYPFILAHEKAHQFGIANEAEANITAFIVCTGSSDRRLQYSGYMHLLLYFLNDAFYMDDYETYLKKIDKFVLEDIVSRQKYYDKLRNRRLENFQNAANNVYLKSQNISKGIKNYNQVVGLMITWYRFSGEMPMESGTYTQINEKSAP